MPRQEWRWLDLGALSPVDTQVIYDAVSVARGRNLVTDTLIFCYPASPLVCVGYHQDVEEEVNIDLCRQLGIPVVRRILGGGTVYLDSDQLFYQIIISQKNPMVPVRIKDAFRAFLQGPVEAYRSLGISAEYRPINEIQVKGRKISGNGATTTLDGVFILTGNILLDFNYNMMVKIIRVPSEKFRDKMFKSLQEWMTTVRRELGYLVPMEEVKKALREGFEKALGISLQQGDLTPEEKRLLQELREKYLSVEWLYMPEYRCLQPVKAHAVKVAAGISVVESDYKSKGGLIRVTMEIAEAKIKDILISGDFRVYPSDALPQLEQALRGVATDRNVINDRISRFYKLHNMRSPEDILKGTSPEDILKAILTAIKEARKWIAPKI